MNSSTYTDTLKHKCISQLSTAEQNICEDQLIKREGLFGLPVLEMPVHDCLSLWYCKEAAILKIKI